jgi:tripartite-type tricarboxylate transporter receptor subunit TctC
MKNTCPAICAAHAVLLGAAMTLYGAGAHAAQPPAFPEHAITVVVPFPAGGPTDASARLFARTMSEDLGQPIVIDNRAGAAGTVGSAWVARANADGYTLLWGGTSTLAVAPGLYKNLRYDAKSFLPVGMALRGPLMLAGRPSLGAQALPELLKLAKSSALSVGTAGNGSIGHLATEYLKEKTGIQMVHVPYRGGSPAITDALGGQVDLVFDTAAALAPYVKTGKLRAYAVTGTHAYAPLPDVPLMQSSVPTYEGYSWFGLVAPAGTPAPVVQRLSQSFAKAAQSPEVKRELTAQGVEPGVFEVKDFSRIIDADFAKWSGLISRAHVRADE